MVGLLAALMSVVPTHGVEYNVNTSTYVATAPDDTASGYSVSGWDSGWSGSDITGWNYVGSVNGASGVYLGNDWVLTAGHVGAGNFHLDGVTYDEVANSARSAGTADLTLYRISSAPDLPSLTLALDPPTAFGIDSPGSSVVMIGYGGGHGETWGENNVTQINEPVSVAGYSSTDFYTLTGTGTYSMGTVTNTAQLVVNDSGGGEFIYDSATSQWQLAGINEAQLINEQSGQLVGSAMVQLSNYDTTIDTIIAVPEPTTWVLLPGGLALLALGVRRKSGAVRGKDQSAS